MAKKRIYPDTDTFHYYNKNPKDRRVGDCVIRAISEATDQSWDDVFEALCTIAMKEKRMPNDKEVYSKYLKNIGYVKCKQPRHDDNTKYIGYDWCRKLNKESSYKSIIAHIGGHHIVCIKPIKDDSSIASKYKVIDIWNSTGGCIGNYWVR